MRHSTILAIVFSLSTFTPCYGQQQADIGTVVNDAVRGAFNSFFGGGELAVRDGVTRTETTITAVKTTAMLIDMLIQAIGGGGPSNLSTAELIARQAEYGQDGSLLYGPYSPGQWNNLYKEDWWYTNGDWLDDYRLRQHARLTTQEDLMYLLKMRQDAFATDADRIRQIKESIDGCAGRNCQIQADGAAVAEVAWQSLQAQQVQMATANAILAAVVGEVNEKTQTDAQQQLFISNMGRELPWPTFTDRGL